MRDCKIDDRKVIAPNARMLCGRGRVLKAGMMFVYCDGGLVRLARSLGRIASCDSDGEDCTGFVVAMVLGADACHFYERWINPAEIQEILESAPTNLAAFFFQPELPFNTATMRRLMEYGTTSERYIECAGARVKQWDSERRQKGQEARAAL